MMDAFCCFCVFVFFDVFGMFGIFLIFLEGLKKNETVIIKYLALYIFRFINVFKSRPRFNMVNWIKSSSIYKFILYKFISSFSKYDT